MKLILLLLIIFGISSDMRGQVVAKHEIKEEIEGICDKNETYALFEIFGNQVVAKCPSTKSSLQSKLNQELKFLKEFPKYKTKGNIEVMINCNDVDLKKTNKEFENQIEMIFKSLDDWIPGELDGDPVDSTHMFFIKIKKRTLRFTY